MSNLVTHKIGACKFDYEFMGKNVNELEQIYGFPAYTIEDAIQTNGWQRKLEPTELPKSSDIDTFAAELEAVTRAKLSIISLFRQIENQPLYAQIEKALLDKLLESITLVSPEDDRAPSKLQNLAKTLESIQARNPVNLADQLKDALDKGPKIIVQIANQVH